MYDCFRSMMLQITCVVLDYCRSLSHRSGCYIIFIACYLANSLIQVKNRFDYLAVHGKYIAKTLWVFL